MYEDLIEKMKVTLATSYAFYLKAHNYHWNVEGNNFSEYHTFFGNLYEEVFGSIDSMAEQIRALDSYAPGSFSRYLQLSTIVDELSVPNSSVMVQRLLEDNDKVISALRSAFEESEKQKMYGLSDFLTQRLDAHSKHRWMLKALSKG